MNNLLPTTDPLDSLLRLIKRQQSGTARGLRPALPGQVDLGHDSPLDSAMLGAIGFASANFSVVNDSSAVIDLGNLSTAAGPAIEGAVVFYDLKRGQDDGMGALSRHVSGLLVINVRYWNGSGTAFMNQLGGVEDQAHPAGVSVSASVSSDRLRLTFACDNSGDDALGQYRCFPWPALSATAPCRQVRGPRAKGRGKGRKAEG